MPLVGLMQVGLELNACSNTVFLNLVPYEAHWCSSLKSVCVIRVPTEETVPISIPRDHLKLFNTTHPGDNLRN